MSLELSVRYSSEDDQGPMDIQAYRSKEVEIQICLSLAYKLVNEILNVNAILSKYRTTQETVKERALIQL